MAKNPSNTKTPEGRLEAIWLKRSKGGPMDPQTTALLISGQGLENNANRGGKRQVTMDRAFPGLRQALEPAWRGGAYGEVLEGGIIRVSDPISWQS